MRGILADEADAAGSTDWVAARADYESNNGTLDEVCARHNTTRSRLARRKTQESWAPRRIGVQAGRQQIINRMFRLLEKQVRTQEVKEVKEVGEKEVAVLGKLASTLEKLIDIDNAEPKVAGPRVKSEEMKELRHKLAQRIARLKRA